MSPPVPPPRRSAAVSATTSPPATPAAVHRSSRRNGDALATAAANSTHASVSLQRPRPCLSRESNIYTPPPRAVPASLTARVRDQQAPQHCHHNSPLSLDHQLLRVPRWSPTDKTHIDGDFGDGGGERWCSPLSSSSCPHCSLSAVVTHQPLKKNSSPWLMPSLPSPPTSTTSGHGQTEYSTDSTDTQQQQQSPSFMCADCGRCRCAACTDNTPDRRRRHLPLQQRALTCVDTVSCMCCVLGVAYHCCPTATDSGSRRLDAPCSCTAQQQCDAGTCARWTLLGAASLLLPCLCCYWPLRACVSLAQLCHTRATTRAGCRCRQTRGAT